MNNPAKIRWVYGKPQSGITIYSKYKSDNISSFKIKLQKEYYYQWTHYNLSVLTNEYELLNEMVNDKALILLNIRNESIFIHTICQEMIRNKKQKIMIYIKRTKEKIILK
jgi:hypothetical protein